MRIYAIFLRYAIGYAWPRQGALIFLSPITVPGSGATEALSVLPMPPPTAPRRSPTYPPSTGSLPFFSLGLGKALNVVAARIDWPMPLRASCISPSYDSS